MNQSARTLAYHQQAITLIQQALDVLERRELQERGGKRLFPQQQVPGRLTPGDIVITAWDEYDPNQQTEQVELRCPVCGRHNCPLDVRRGM